MRQALVWGVGVVSVVLALPAQADTLARGQGEGLPAQFVNYHAGDALVERGEPTKGQTVQAAE